MCGRYVLSDPVASLCKLFGIDIQALLTPRFNIAPTQSVPIVRNAPDNGQREFKFVRWGLIPKWAKDDSAGAKMINARAETITEKPSYREAFKRRRCLIPTTGFYEWKRIGKSKEPFYIRMKDRQPFAMAGLWESWQPSEGAAVESCTIITTGPNEIMRPIHDRMAVIVAPENYATWLDPATKDTGKLSGLLRPFDAQKMEAIPVSNYVNSAAHEGPQCINPSAQGNNGLLF